MTLSIEEGMMTGEQLGETVAATRGFSGADIRDMMLTLQSALVESEQGQLNTALAWKVIEEKVKHHWEMEAMGEHFFSYLDGDQLDLQDVTFV